MININKNNQNIFIFLSIFLINLQFALNVIIIPFNTYNPLISKDKKILDLINNAKDNDIINTLSSNLIYTNLTISDEKKNIKTFISMSSIQFYFKDIDMNNNTHPKELEGYFNFTFNDNYILKNLFKLNYYNASLSKSYKFISEIEDDFYTAIYSFDKGVYGNEIFYFQTKNKIKEKELNKKLNLIMTYRQSVRFDHRPGVIGLAFFNEFIPELKRVHAINNYEFTFKYNDINEERGELIIGDSPHIYDENYQEKDIRSAMIVKDYYTQWSFMIDNIYIENYNYNFKRNEIGIFKIEEFFILGTTEYFELIQNIFFNQYIKENLCVLQTHKNHPFADEYFHFMCYIKDNKKREKFFKSFPSLIFFQKEMYYNFTFEAKDLFTIIPDGNRILFNIEFNNKNKKWEFGKPFFKKYQLVFDMDSKLIKYYINTNNEDNEIKIKNNKKMILIMTILIIFVFIFGIYIGKLLCSKYNRKIRANELEDNYSYIPKNIDDKNDMKIIRNTKEENLINDKNENKLGMSN